MKTNILTKLALSALLGCSVIACDEASFLDTSNPNEVTNDNFWRDEADANSAMATIYSPIRGQMYGNFGAFTGFQNQNVRADDVWTIYDDLQTWDIAVFQNDPNTDRYDFGSFYSSINRANVFLENIAKVPMDDAKKDQMIGEAHFLRGFNYFLLVTNYGEAPLRLKPVVFTADAMAPSVSSEELWKQVVADMTEAKNRLPIDRPAEEAGRVTKGAAIAYLGKSYIWQKQYKEGKQELEIIMKSPYKYDLMANYEDNFTPNFKFNKESIFELNYAKYGSGSWNAEGANDTQGMVLPNFIGTPLTGGWFKMMPTASIIDEFLVEKRPNGSESLFDKRIYTNFFFKYSDYGDVKADEKWYGNRYSFDQLWKSTEGKRSGGKQPIYPEINGKEGRFLPKKFTAFWLDKENGDSMYNPEPIDNNYRVMRFAEILLLHAEAATNSGNLAEAATDLNRIRNRAGLPNKTWGSASELMAEIQHQNLLEFWFEGHRFFDLQRWHTAPEIKDIFVKNKKQGADKFKEKYTVYPLPQSELNTNTEIQQHPLWR